ncbi:cytochrome P450 704C1-like isoform X2 [Phragmites australis]|uniref:cytochrome P450 704C1-like isoform X2 n=1 Tax=Phragmites australis TaxID=29695 RepID=UPI002D7758B5|nr:cytochrome P450 704C1-like isoform X2 [Phragmites australis]
MASQLSSLAASAGLCLLSVLAIALLAVTLYILGVVASFAVFCIKEFALRAEDRPPLIGTMFRMLKNYDRMFDEHVEYALAHRTSRMVFPDPGHSELWTSDPAVIEHVLKTSFRKYSKGDFNIQIMKDLFGDGIFATDGDKWRHQRKLASHEFSTKVLRDFSSGVFRKNAAKLAEKISSAAANRITIDMQELLMKTTMDSIFKVGFGLELNTLSGSDESGIQFSEAFDEANYLVYHRYVDIFWQLKRFLNIGSEAKLKRSIQTIDNFVMQLIHQKREQMKNRRDYKSEEDILSRFILASEKDPETMNDRYLRDIVLNFLIAGKDTTANALSWFFYMLCKNPIVQDKVALEINESLEGDKEDNNIKNFTSRLNEGAIDKMQYLHAAISETLRLYPAVPVDGKMADEDDTLPNGYRVIKGDGVNYMIYAMGRMTYLWGEDAEEFRPERWIVNGVFQQESPYKFVSFNAGPRICLGKDFAYRQMKIVAATLIHLFRFKLADESKNPTYRPMFTLHIDKGLHLYAYPRSV